MKDVGSYHGQMQHALLTPSTPSIKPVLVVEEMAMAYFTLRGIENKLGVKKEDIPAYILRELIDNGLDCIPQIIGDYLSFD